MVSHFIESMLLNQHSRSLMGIIPIRRDVIRWLGTVGLVADGAIWGSLCQAPKCDDGGILRDNEPGPAPLSCRA